MRKLLLLLLLPAAAALAGESGVALKADSLRAEPYADAKVQGSISKNETLEILATQGGWLQVKTAKASGWVRLLAVRRGGATATGSSAGSVLNVASGRAGTGQVVATTGVRGLNEEELKNARFDAAQIDKLESYTTDAAQAQDFARADGLKAVPFDYLPAGGTTR